MSEHTANPNEIPEAENDRVATGDLTRPAPVDAEPAEDPGSAHDSSGTEATAAASTVVDADTDATDSTDATDATVSRTVPHARIADNLPASPATPDPSPAAGTAPEPPRGLPPMPETVTPGRDTSRIAPSSDARSTGPAAWSTPAAPPEPAFAEQTGPLRARFGPILWGVLLLTFAAYVFSVQLFPERIDTSIWATAALIGTGAILVIAGIAAALRRDR